MLDLTHDVHPLSDFTRNTSEFLAQLQKSGHPVVLTIDGKAELVVQDVTSYQKLLTLAERSETTQAVKESLAEVDRGEGRPSDEVFDDLEVEIQQQPPKKRQLGTMKGSVLWMAPDFDAPLDDFREYME